MQCWSQEETCVAETISRDVEQRRGAEDFGDVEQRISETDCCGAGTVGDAKKTLKHMEQTWRHSRSRGGEGEQ